MSSSVNKLTSSKIGILGPGEVGLSLKSLYSTKGVVVATKDKNDTFFFEKLDILNVCIPYTNRFIETVKEEILHSNPTLTIVHSTVPIGTTNKLSEELSNDYNIVHSPVRGNHPNLSQSIQTFVKYVGSNNPTALKLAVTHLRELDIQIHACNTFEKTEAAKLLCTTYYGLCIAWHNEVKTLCEKHNINLDLIKNWNETYNKGYEAMGMKKFTRPILDPPTDHKIGGHCVIPNAELLNNEFESNLIKEILTYQ